MKTVERKEFEKNAGPWLDAARDGETVKIVGEGYGFTLDVHPIYTQEENEAFVKRLLERPGVPGITTEMILDSIREGRR